MCVKLFKVFLLSFFFCHQLNAQVDFGTVKNNPIDSLNLVISKNIANALEKGNLTKAKSYCADQSAKSSGVILRQLDSIAKNLKQIHSQTKRNIQISYKNYRNSFNLTRIVYYNDEGIFYLFELFFQKNDIKSELVEIFIRDPIALKNKRAEVAKFKKEHPSIPQPPPFLPPGIFIKEHN